MKVSTISLIGVSGFLLVLAAFRIAHIFVTGYILPDEAIYFSAAYYTELHGVIGLSYGAAQLYQLLEIAIAVPFRLGATQTTAVMVFVSWLASIGCLLVVAVIGRRFDTEDPLIGLAILFVGLSSGTVIASATALTGSLELLAFLIGLWMFLTSTAVSWKRLASVAPFIVAYNLNQAFYLPPLLLGLYSLYQSRLEPKPVLMTLGFLGVLDLFTTVPLGLFNNTWQGYSILAPITNPPTVANTFGTLNLAWQGGSLQQFQLRPELSLAILGILILFSLGPSILVLPWLLTHRRRLPQQYWVVAILMPITMLVGLGIYAGTFTYAGTNLYNSLSTMLRLSIIGSILPASLAFLGNPTKSLKGPAILFVGLLLLAAPQMIGVAQTNLSGINKATFLYVAPWERIQSYLGPGDLVIGDALVRPYLFTPTSENVTFMVPNYQPPGLNPATPTDEAWFLHLAGSYKHVFLYGEKYPNWQQAMNYWAPWLLPITRNSTLLWNDSESFLYQWS